MKNIYLAMGFLLIGINNLTAQEELTIKAKQDIESENSSVNYKVSDDIRVKLGGRVSFDGANYQNDFTDMSSGVQLGEARINMFATLSNSLDLKFSVDFAGRSPEHVDRDVDFKDIYLRWKVSENNSWKIGHFTQPFSMGRIISGNDNSFASRSATTNSLTDGRRLGISYRTVSSENNIWAEASVFGGDVYKRKTGDDGYGLSGRFVYNPKINEDLRIHLGLGLSTKTPDANNFTDGDDDYNRRFSYKSNVETLIDKTNVLNADVEWAKRENKCNGEVMVLYKNFIFQGEYTGVNISRERDNQRLYEEQLGGMWSFPTLDSWENWYGKELRNISFKGYYFQTGWIVKGGDYKYNSSEALAMTGREKGTIELIARFNKTDLNDIDGAYYNGNFYDPNLGVGVDKPNYSVSGGVLTTYTLGVNYYFNPNIRLLTSYGYNDINNLGLQDKYAHVFQTRLQVSF